MPDAARHLPPADLSAGDRTDDFTHAQTDPPGLAAVPDPLLSRPPVPAVPGYDLLGEVGRGGMGVVYRARDLTFGRDVAVKLVGEAHRHDPRAAARFLAEARITGRLQHPGVPAAHALGELADGSPYLAMKLVEGQTLAALLRARPAPGHDLARFVGIFEGVCQAVGFAHSKGIIHRDLKPANVMVGSFGEVQVMDWGLAKELRNAEFGVRNQETDAPSSDPRSATRSPHPEDPGATTAHHTPDTDDRTRAGVGMGTPAYMPPEQANGQWDRVGPAADVFALGSILCAVLTDKPAYAGAAGAEVLRKAAAGDLADAHARLDGCGADAELVALCRRCLSPDPADRPADAGAVAAEVAAYRTGVDDRARRAQAAAAVAEAEGQRQKRRVQLVLGSAVVVTLLAGGGAAGWQWRAADRARADAVDEATNARRAEAEEKDARGKEAEQRAEAELQGRTANEVKAYIQSILGQAAATGQLDSGGTANPRLTVREALDRATPRLDGRFPDRPLVEAEVRKTIAAAYFGVGDLVAAEAQSRRAADLYARALGPAARPTLFARLGLGRVLYDRSKYRSAEEVYAEAREAAERAYGPDDTITLEAGFMLGLAYTRRPSAADRGRGVAMMRDTLARMRQVFGTGVLVTLNGMTTLAGVYADHLRRPDLAEPLLAEALPVIRAKYGLGHPYTLTIQAALAQALGATGRGAEAEPLWVAAVARLGEVYGDAHPTTIECLTDLAHYYDDQGRTAEAEPLLARALAAGRAVGAADGGFSLLNTMSRLARVYTKLGQQDRAEPLYRELSDTLARLGHRNKAYYFERASLGVALFDQGKFAEAGPVLVEVYKWAAAAARDADPDGDADPDELRALADGVAAQLAAVYEATGKPAEARKWAAKLPAGTEPRRPPAPPPREVRR